MSRVPIRVRLTLGFAAAMAVVLAVVGLFVYRRVANELLRTVDQTLVAQAQEEIHRGSVDADIGSGPTLAQLFGPRGHLRGRYALKRLTISPRKCNSGIAGNARVGG